MIKHKLMMIHYCGLFKKIIFSLNHHFNSVLNFDFSEGVVSGYCKKWANVF